MSPLTKVLVLGAESAGDAMVADLRAVGYEVAHADARLARARHSSSAQAAPS